MSRIKRAKTGGGPIFFIKEGLINIFVNGFMSFAAVSIIAICILIVGSFSLVALNVNLEIAKTREESQIRIFIDENYGKTPEIEDVEGDGEIESLDDVEALDEGEDETEQETDTLEDVLEEEVEEKISYDQIEADILKVKDVREIEFLSKEQSLEIYKEQLGDGSVILEGFDDDNPLRDGYIIYLDTLENIDDVTAALSAVDGIANVASSNETYKALNSLEDGVGIMTIALLVALSVICIFIISNTVKLAMFSRREEISIMKMIGATNAFIRWPFIIEGLILGVLGAGIAYLAQWFIYNEFIEIASVYIGFMDIITFEEIQIDALYAFLGVGAMIGVLGSTLTIRKFLDV